MTKLGFIGLGNMGAAILRGFKASPDSANVALYAYDADISKEPLIEQTGGRFLKSEADTAAECKYILLAVKPQSADEVLRKIAPALTGESVIISICAGITAEFIRKRTTPATKIIRVMPNTPMMLGVGASAISTDSFVSAEELIFAEKVIKSCGIAEHIPPEKMNEIICVNASAPAFIYLFAKSFADYAEEQGIPQKAAMNLFAQTLVGAGKMLMETGISPEVLIAQVSSKGGTTVAGLEQLREKGLPEAVKAACEACTKRAYELGREEQA